MDKNRAGGHQHLSTYLTSLAFLILACTGSLLLQSCDHGLAHKSLRDIEWEKNDWEKASRALDASAKVIANAMAASPELFKGTTVSGEWHSRLEDAKGKLANSERDDRKLTNLAHQDRASSQAEVERLLTDARALRESAVSEAKGVEENVAKWQSFSADPGSALTAVEKNLRSIQAVDFGTLSQTVEKAERDWPAKKADLDGRLAALKSIEKSAETRWEGAQELKAQVSGGKLAGPQLGALVSLDEDVARDRASLASGVQQLTDLSGQLYLSWDKILADLEISRFGRENVYRERVRTVRTRLLDPATNRSEVTDEERWVPVPEQAYRSVENDIGMTIAHKDSGLYDSEASYSPQPPGFAYLASPETGSNRYGHWTHSGGQTFWSFLPEYILLRELLRSHDYRPIQVNEYRGYTAARTAGKTYYGGNFSSSPATRTPTYGTHGSFTAKNYSTSRYVQSGGFRSSAYASNRDHAGFSGFTSARPEPPHSGIKPSSSGAGKRFGSGAAPSSGRRFGRSGGLGRSFGRRR